MLPNLTNQYISYSMAIFSANEIRTFESRSSLLSWVKKSVQKVIFYTDIYEEENKKFGTNFSTYIAVLENNSIECTDFQSSTDWNF